MNELTARENFNAETLEKVLIQGDLSKLSSQERLRINLKRLLK